MEILKIIGITDYDYNMLLLELGCQAAEQRYPPTTASTIKAAREYWTWARQQQTITDTNFIKTMQSVPEIWATRKILLLYKDTLALNLEKVSFPRRFEQMLLMKSKAHERQETNN